MKFDEINAVAAALTLGNAVEGASHTVGPWPESDCLFAVIDNDTWTVVVKATDAFDAAAAFVRVESQAESTSPAVRTAS